MILVPLLSTGDVHTLRALREALPALSFRAVLGEGVAAGTDGLTLADSELTLAHWVAAPKLVELLLLPSQRAAQSPLGLALTAYFRAIGVRTLQLQDRWLQPHNTLAHELVLWDDGVGFLKSELRFAAYAGPPGYVLVTPGGAAVSEALYQLAMGTMRLASRYPQRHFVWRPHPDGAPGDRAVDDMITGYALPNLCIERELPAEALVPGSFAVLTGLSTVMVDCELQQKPTLVQFLGAHDAATRTFWRAHDLLNCFEELLAAPERHRVQTGARPLDRARLAQVLAHACATTALAEDWQRHALAALAPGGMLAQLTADQQVGQLTKELRQLRARVELLHKSTLAFKAKRLWKQIRG